MLARRGRRCGHDRHRRRRQPAAGRARRAARPEADPVAVGRRRPAARRPALPADVPLARMVDPALAAAMAETALWAVLGLQRGFFDYARQQAAREWRQLPQRRADETRVAVLGLGAMGRAVARAAGAARPARHRLERARRAAIDGVALRSGAGALPPLLAAADIVVNLLPLTRCDARPVRRPGLRLDAPRRRLRQPRARRARRRGRSAGRARRRPARPCRARRLRRRAAAAGHAFWSHPRVTVLPHVAALTDPRSAAAVVAANVRALREGPGADAPRGSRLRGY